MLKLRSIIGSRSVNAFLSLLDVFANPIVNSHFVQVMRSDFEILRWIRKLLCDSMIVPVHSGKHWLVVLLSKADATITLYDSWSSLKTFLDVPGILPNVADLVHSELEDKISWPKN